MKIVFFSDIHGNILSLMNMFEMLKTIEYDHIVFGGDIFGYYYHQPEIIEQLREHKINCLLGNHDKLFLDLVDGKINEEALIARYGNSYLGIRNKISDDQLAFLRELEPRKELTVDSKKIVFVHGSLDDPVDGRIYPDTKICKTDIYDGIDVVFCGHTHHKLFKKVNDTFLINPGSAGQQRDGKGCSFVLYDTRNGEYKVYVVNYDVKSLEQEVIANDTGKMRERLIEVLYRTAQDAE